jgi:hypothetical protein
MTRKFRPEQCPTCQYNAGTACRNAYEITMPGDVTMAKHTEWSPFSGYTERQCKRYKQNTPIIPEGDSFYSEYCREFAGAGPE